MADFHFHHLYLLLFSLIIFSILKISPARDTISLDDPLPENETIISSGGTFEMGIFSPSFTFSYVGIWYKNIPARPVVWVANRKVPLSKNVTSLVLKIVNSSHLALLSNANDVVLSVNTSLSFSSPVMQLLDSGNLVVRDAGDENPENFFWQSFDYPTDTYLPGMKMGINFETGHEVYLSAWKSAEDPSPSEYTSNLLVTGYPQGIIRQGKALICRSGPWNGVRWSGIPSPDINPIYNYVLVINKTEIYTNYSLVKKSVISVLYMNYTGVVHRLMWVEGMRDWITIGKLPTDDCDRYGNCGGNGLCNIGNFPVCGCLDHFLPRNQADWGMAKFAGGCVRKKSLECHTGKDPGGFLKYSGIKVPDTQNSWYNETMTLQECQQECLKNCNCTAFSSLDVRNGGSECSLQFSLDPGLGSRREHRKILEIVAVSLSAVAGLIVVGLSLMLYVRRKKKTKFLRDEDFELPVFHLRTIARATNNFSADNKLGEGGFGPVYKGVLENGQEIAVKRLSKASVQGIHEFKNEVVFIAKLQHRNLVSILGCCIQGEEQMLIYEYMPNRSLDLFIFGMAYSEKPVFLEELEEVTSKLEEDSCECLRIDYC
nr:G-type lectin S-receptor-like serine/threonine-protein kinase At4g27290 isoform X1 [Ipomoea batatas]